MFSHSKNRLNKFVHVEIPKNSDYFARLNGNLPTAPKNAYSGDEYIPKDMNPTEILDYMQRKGNFMAKQAENNKSE